MNISRILIFLLLSFMLSGCINNDTEKKEIQFSEIPETECNELKLYSDVRIVPLETTDSALLKNPAIASCLDNNDFIILTGFKILHFSKDGKFINQIGRRGDGPEEYPNFWAVRTIGNNVYVFVSNGDVYQYTVDGYFINKFHIDTDEGMLMGVTVNPSIGQFICEIRKYEENGLTINAVVVDRNFKPQKRFIMYSDVSNHETDFLASAKMRLSEGKTLILIPFYNIIQTIDENGICELCEINKNEIPDRKIFEDFEYRNINEGEFYQITDFQSTPAYLYFDLNKGIENKRIIYDRISGKYIFVKSVRRSEEEPNKRAGILFSFFEETRFFPSYSQGNAVAGFIYPEELTDEELRYVMENSFSKNNITYESNPILVICTEK